MIVLHGLGLFFRLRNSSGLNHSHANGLWLVLNKAMAKSASLSDDCRFTQKNQSLVYIRISIVVNFSLTRTICISFGSKFSGVFLISVLSTFVFLIFFNKNNLFQVFIDGFFFHAPTILSNLTWLKWSNPQSLEPNLLTTASYRFKSLRDRLFCRLCWNFLKICKLILFRCERYLEAKKKNTRGPMTNYYVYISS